MFCGVYSVCIVYGVFGLDFGGVHSVCTVYEAFRLIVFLCAYIVSSVYGALGSDVCGIFTVFVAELNNNTSHRTHNNTVSWFIPLQSDSQTLTKLTKF